MEKLQCGCRRHGRGCLADVVGKREESGYGGRVV